MFGSESFKMKSIIFLLSLICFCWAGNSCMYGPSYWCMSEAIAKQCGVSLFCKALSRSNTNSKNNYIKFSSSWINKEVNYPPVQITLYYESLCPDCKETWQYQLFPTFQRLQSSGILKITLIPFGNANETKRGDEWDFTCQHGSNECKGNLIETCAISHYPDPNIHIPYVHCMEYYGPTLTNSKYCGKLSGMDDSVIESCVSGKEGNLLEHQMALVTNSLNPPHTSVPWFTMYGVHTDEIQAGLNTNMLAYVCDKYTGPKPSACTQKSPKGCYKNL